MPISKGGDNKLVQTPVQNGDIFEQTGVIRAHEFAVCDQVDLLKQIQFDTSAQTTNTVVTLKSGANAANITLTLPATSGTLATGTGASFVTMQTPAGTSPVATGADTLTLTSTGGTVTITGNSTTDTINFESAAGGITQLTGDVTAGPGSGSQAATVDATSAATASKIAKRDSNADCSFRKVNAVNVNANVPSLYTTGMVNIRQDSDSLFHGLNIESVSSSSAITICQRDSAECFFYNSNGNVWLDFVGAYGGTGPTSPLVHFDINGYDGNTTLGTPTAGVWAVGAIRNVDTTVDNLSTLALMNGANKVSAAVVAINHVHSATVPEGYLSLLVANASTTLTEAVRIDNTGQVKIQQAGKGLSIKEGSNAKMGTATLNGITAVTVSTTAVTASSRIFVTIQASGGTVGSPYVDVRTAGTSFDLKSTAVGDTSTVAWMIVEPS